MSLKINGFDVKLVDSNPPGSQQAGPYTGFNPSTTILYKGHKRPGRDDVAAFQSDAIWERDFPVPMRDSVTLRADIFRPTTEQKVPAILLWSPYGKDNNGEGVLKLLCGDKILLTSETYRCARFTFATRSLRCALQSNEYL